MRDHSIEARLLCIAGIAGHAYWVLLDERGSILAELHGLATDRHADPDRHRRTQTRTARLALPARCRLRQRHRRQPDRTSYLRDGQPARTAASGDKHEILAR
ncbi:hypothetical protein [Xanthomonas translucens]|uniref:Uncharacterized protein n=1 Tax=Xanthomonas translucens pv. translucens TaxID=134875 RepID=A0ABW9L0Y0_XANCT|nr:hypothetical protein [Xanthomonas translucens]MCS3359769.1 hypothetical protein [Xanthomonas translucens pv. translucens]MCS3373444.1 hypothetical protein [Xanthomonas translucens pv. translucens]MCT8275127.1 hypothetical protein [Xanthomonas translucens pv. translucens]MCT8278180.1 hypothetical protein [Xanthomonas translucens pv. translucens]MCT8289296.1 hypothetical protein [Xanthomonas translucens pv. translucens]